MIDTHDLYWLAGLLEGEGCFSIDLYRPYPIMTAKICMTDKDVIERCRDIVKIGRITGPYSQNGNKETWRWTVTTQKDVAALMMTVYPLMGERRKKKIESMLKTWKSFPYLSQRPCPKNHDPKHFYTNHRGYRSCRLCVRASNQRSRDKLLYG